MRRVTAAPLAQLRRTLRWSPLHVATTPFILKNAAAPPPNAAERGDCDENNDDDNPGGGQRGKFAPRRRQRGGGDGGPVKDRFPPLAADLSDPRRRLALLVDASSVEPRVFRNTILPAARKVGVPVLVRLFAVQLSGDWEPLVAGSGGTAANSRGGSDDAALGTTGTLPCPPVEFFRVERFIPIPMQIEADANHIFDFRQQNKIEAVCFVCGEVDRGVFEGFLPNIAGNGFNQYVLDELGMAKEVLEDGRSADGSA